MSEPAGGDRSTDDCGVTTRKTGICPVCARRQGLLDGVLKKHRPQGTLRPCTGSGEPPQRVQFAVSQATREGSTTIGSRLPPPLLARLDAFCATENLNRASAVRVLVDVALRGHRPESAVLTPHPKVSARGDKRAGPIGDPPTATVPLPVPDPTLLGTTEPAT